MKTGKVWLVGAGPCDAGLITVKGARVLEQADVVVYDRLVGPGIISRIPRRARSIPVGKEAGKHPVPQEGINHILLREALAGNRVVRLKGGDPFVFGRGGEELELLSEHGIPFEVVPGVTSAVAVPAYAGIPVTHRDYSSSLHIITGHRKGEEELPLDYEALVRLGGTLVFLMGVSALSEICTGLLAAGMPPNTPAAVLERGTSCSQRRVVSTVEKLSEEAARQNIRTPSVIVVGGVCALSSRFAWAEKRELSGLRVIVTRPRALCSALTEMLEEAGAEVVALPAIETEELEDTSRLWEALEHRERYSWAAFTSAAGVRAFFHALRVKGMDMRAVAHLKFAAIGKGTASALLQLGINADYVPSAYHAAALGAGLAPLVPAGTRVLIPRAQEGTPALTRELAACGAAYDDIPVYRTLYAFQAAKEVRLLLERENTYVTFTSASTVRGFVRGVGAPDYSAVRAVCIGEQTAEQARSYGMQVLVSEEATIESMVACLKKRKEND